MKQFLKYFFLIGILFFVFDKGLCYFIYHAPQKEYDRRLELILEGKMNKDIVIIGSSRGAKDIIAKQIEDKTQLSTYNLSYRGSNVIFHEFILSTLLKFNKPPKTVLLVLDGAFEFIETPTLNFRSDRLLPLKNYNYINEVLIRRGEKNLLSKVFCLSRIDRKDFSLRKVKVGVNDSLTAHGSMIETIKSKKDIVFNNQLEAYTSEDEIPEYLQALIRIKDLCKLNNIELVFVFPPNFESFNTSFLYRFSEYVNDEKVFVYDTLNPKYKNERYFKDSSHLLKNGAELFTSELIDFINEKKNTTK